MAIMRKTLRRRLLATKRHQFVGLVAITEPDMRVRGNPWAGHARKISWVAGVINARYARVVNRQRKREHKRQDFTASPRAWGVRLPNCPLVEYEGEHYLEIKVQHRRERFVDRRDRSEIPREELAPYLIAPSKPKRQGLHRSVALRDYRLDHIAQLTIAGETWSVRPCCLHLAKFLDSIPALSGSSNTEAAA